MAKRIFYGCLVVALIAGGIINLINPPSSHFPAKSDTAFSQIEVLRKYANDSKEPFLQMATIDNKSFVSTAKLSESMLINAAIWKFNGKGELLDPWGYPYIFSRNNSEIVVTSVGLDRYNKLSTFHKWLSNE